MSEVVSVPILRPASWVSMTQSWTWMLAALAVVDGLAAALDDHAVVAGGDVAVADFDVARVVGIDAVAVGHVEQVADLDVVDQHAIAAEHVQAPVGRLGEGDVADLQVLAAGEDEHLGAEWAGHPDAAGIVVAGHELLGAALDVAGAADGETLRAGGRDDRAECRGHGVTVLRTGQASAIVFALRADEEFGVVGEMEVDGALEFDGADEVLMAAADENLRLACVGRGLVDGALEGCAVQRFAIARCAVLEYIEDLDLRIVCAWGRLRAARTLRRECIEWRERSGSGEGCACLENFAARR